MSDAPEFHVRSVPERIAGAADEWTAWREAWQEFESREENQTEKLRGSKLPVLWGELVQILVEIEEMAGSTMYTLLAHKGRHLEQYDELREIRARLDALEGTRGVEVRATPTGPPTTLTPSDLELIIDSRVEARVTQNLADSFAGTWAATTIYERGQTTVCDGSFWLAMRSPTAGARPGRSDAWRLLAGKGRDGRDHPSRDPRNRESTTSKK